MTTDELITYKARVFMNQTHGHRFWEYHDGDVLKPSMVNPVICQDMPDEEGSRLLLCEYFFAWLNGIDRPNGKTEPSLSCGDVVVFEDPNGTLHAYAVDHIGFKKLEGWKL